MSVQLSRRFFLGGVLAVAGATVIPAPLKALSVPCIWGDGIHDDAPGLNALFAREPVNIVNDALQILKGDHIALCEGTFLIRTPVTLHNHALITHNIFIASNDFDGDEMMRGTKDSSFNYVSNNHFRRADDGHFAIGLEFTNDRWRLRVMA